MIANSIGAISMSAYRRFSTFSICAIGALMLHIKIANNILDNNKIGVLHG